MSHHLDRLRSNIHLRKEEKYLHPDTEDEIAKLVESEEYDGEMIVGVFDQFFGNFDLLLYFHLFSNNEPLGNVSISQIWQWST